MKILDPKQEGAEQLQGTFLEESPEDSKKTDVYLAGLSELLYSKDTSQKIFEGLKAASPEKSIPMSAITLNSRMEEELTKKGSPPSLSTKVNANLFLVSELTEMGNAGGAFNINQDQMVGIFQETLKQYIHKGIKNKTIDPIELQQVMEGLMSDEQKQQGMALAQQSGVPEEPGVSHAMEKYASGKLQKQEAKHQGILQKMQQQLQSRGQVPQGGNQNGQ